MFHQYSKKELELIAALLYENLSASNALYKKMSIQNKLLSTANDKLRNDFVELKEQLEMKGVI